MIEFNNGFNHRESKFYLYSQKLVAFTGISQEVEFLGCNYRPDVSSFHRNHNQVCR